MQPIELKVNDLLTLIGYKEAALIQLSSQLQACAAENTRLKAEIAALTTPHVTSDDGQH